MCEHVYNCLKCVSILNTMYIFNVISAVADVWRLIIKLPLSSFEKWVIMTSYRYSNVFVVLMGHMGQLQNKIKAKINQFRIEIRVNLEQVPDSFRKLNSFTRYQSFIQLSYFTLSTCMPFSNTHTHTHYMYLWCKFTHQITLTFMQSEYSIESWK